MSNDNWIKVEDRLPREGEQVDVIRHPAWAKIGFRNADVYHEAGRFVRERTLVDCTGAYMGLEEVQDVTHWQPLPSPPEDSHED